jgi:DNA-binding NarL/FixJ family response regulator
MLRDDSSQDPYVLLQLDQMRPQRIGMLSWRPRSQPGDEFIHPRRRVRFEFRLVRLQCRDQLRCRPGKIVQTLPKGFVIGLGEGISAPMHGFVQPDQRHKNFPGRAKTRLCGPDRFGHLRLSPLRSFALSRPQRVPAFLSIITVGQLLRCPIGVLIYHRRAVAVWARRVRTSNTWNLVTPRYLPCCRFRQLSVIRFQAMSQPHSQLQEPVLPGPIAIVEDDPNMQLRLRVILTTLGYTEDAFSFASSIAEAQVMFDEQPFALALVDVGLPDGSGIDLIRELHQRDAALPVLVISAWSTEQVILSALQAGATGYLLKDRDDMELSLSVRSALRGGAPIDPFIAKRILEVLGGAGTKPPSQAAPQAPGAQLSPREAEILTFVSKGLTNQEISSLLSLSRLTVECHIKNIYKKLEVNSRTQAVFEARSLGLLP